jgi:hypothetical protein
MLGVIYESEVNELLLSQRSFPSKLAWRKGELRKRVSNLGINLDFNDHRFKRPCEPLQPYSSIFSFDLLPIRPDGPIG